MCRRVPECSASPGPTSTLNTARLCRYSGLPAERIEASLALIHDFRRIPRAAALTETLAMRRDD